MSGYDGSERADKDGSRVVTGTGTGNSDSGSTGTADVCPPRRNHRQKSLMREVRDRLENLPDITALQSKLEAQRQGQTHRAATVAAITASLSAPELCSREGTRERHCRASFRAAIVCTTAAATLLCCLGTFMPVAVTRMRLLKETSTAEDLDVWSLSSDILTKLSDSIQRDIKVAGDLTVDRFMSSFMQHSRNTQNLSGATCIGFDAGHRGCAHWSENQCKVWSVPERTPGLTCASQPAWGERNLSSKEPARSWSDLWQGNGSTFITWFAQVDEEEGPAPVHLTFGATFDLAQIDNICRKHWEDLRDRLQSVGVAISKSDAVLFLARDLEVNSRVEEEDKEKGSDRQLQLLGASESSASSGHSSLVEEASSTILKHPGESRFVLTQSQSARLPPMTVARVMLRRLWLSGASPKPWLAVLVLVDSADPEAVPAKAAAPGPAPVLRGSHGLGSRASRLWQRLDEAWQAGLVALIGTALLSLLLALGLGHLVSYPLRQLDSQMRQLGDFDFSHESLKASLSKRSAVTEVGNLQKTFGHLSHAIEAFAKFVPETVVHRIVRGDPRAARLHVSRRHVTIMFSDIRDFTSLSESLAECDLLFVLTRYLSVMTRIAEYFGGIVAEVLGDGLLVFWNTPDDVSDHPAKGCQAALAMQQAMVFLNEEFSKLQLPQLAIRVGLHTGHVLSGNLGSEMKMKFGCLGDPINLASRLEGLCKFYGVGIICSGSTHDVLPPDYGLFCRKLDLVQVKGKSQATWIYEVMGHEPGQEATAAATASTGSNASAAAFAAQARAAFCKAASTAAMDAIHRSTLSLCHSVSSAEGSEHPSNRSECWSDAPLDFITPEQRALAELYEKALDAYREARFVAARDLATALLERHPEDTATRRLLERLGKYLGQNGEGPIGLTEAERASWTGIYIMGEK